MSLARPRLPEGAERGLRPVGRPVVPNGSHLLQVGDRDLLWPADQDRVPPPPQLLVPEKPIDDLAIDAQVSGSLCNRETLLAVHIPSLSLKLSIPRKGATGTSGQVRGLTERATIGTMGTWGPRPDLTRPAAHSEASTVHLEPYWEQDRLTIYHGDCLRVLAGIPDGSIHSIVTDPPFTFAGGISNGFSSRADSQFFEHWLVDVFVHLYRVSRPEAAWFLWADWRSVTVYDAALQKAAPDYHNARWVSQVLIHDREMVGMGSPFRNQTDWIALVRGKKTDFGERIPNDQPNILHSYWYYGKHEHHPAEKDPVLAERLVRWLTPEGGTVLDPFMGGGATLLGAEKAGCRAIGIDREIDYCQVAARRLEKSAIKQLTLEDTVNA